MYDGLFRVVAPVDESLCYFFLIYQIIDVS